MNECAKVVIFNQKIGDFGKFFVFFLVISQIITIFDP